MKRDYLDYLEDITESMNKAIKFTQGMTYEDFLKDEKQFLLW